MDLFSNLQLLHEAAISVLVTTIYGRWRGTTTCYITGEELEESESWHIRRLYRGFLHHAIYECSQPGIAKIALADRGGGVPGVLPLQDPILSFLHTFSAKNARIGGPCPP